jgi:hypothetical protein
MKTLFPEKCKSKGSLYFANKGKEYEDNVFKLLKEKFGDDLVKVEGWHKYKETLKLIEESTPIIYQGWIKDNDSMLIGNVDFLIKGNMVPSLFETCNDDVKDWCMENPNTYVVMDVKFKTLQFKDDFVVLTRDENIYNQLYIYNELVGKITGTKCPFSLVFGKNSTYSTNPFYSPSVLEFNENDYFDLKYVVNLYNYIVNNAKQLYDTLPQWILPNCSVESYSPFIEFKKKQIMKNHVATLPYCKKLLRLKGKNVKVNDSCINQEFLGLTDLQWEIVENMKLIQNKQLFKSKYPVEPLNKKVIFLDVETMSSCVNTDPLSLQMEPSSFLYLIGFVNDDKYNKFLVKHYAHSHERENFKNFLLKMKELNYPTIVYYYADYVFMKKVFDRHVFEDDVSEIFNKLEWFDLYKYITKTNLTVFPDVYNYKLKTIANVVFNNHYDIEDIAHTFSIVEKYLNNNSIPCIQNEMKQVLRYNKKDCSVLKDLYNFIGL